MGASIEVTRPYLISLEKQWLNFFAFVLIHTKIKLNENECHVTSLPLNMREIFLVEITVETNE